ELIERFKVIDSGGVDLTWMAAANRAPQADRTDWHVSHPEELLPHERHRHAQGAADRLRARATRCGYRAAESGDGILDTASGMCRVGSRPGCRHAATWGNHLRRHGARRDERAWPPDQLEHRPGAAI